MNSSILINDIFKIWPVVPGTLLLSFLILIIGIILGAALNKQQESGRLGKVLVSLYLSYFRGIPLLIHLFISYFGLPLLLTSTLPHFMKVNTVALQRISPLYAIIISYSLYTAAFMVEIIRGSFKAVDNGQLEAASALGYTNWQKTFYIQLPQALTEALPKFLNYYLLLIRQLSLAFMVSFVDIFAKAQLQSAVNYRYIESYVAAAVVYWILCVGLSIIFRRIENNLRRYQQPSA